MTLCAACKEYPEGTHCTMTGCPGGPFPARPVSRVPGPHNEAGDVRAAPGGGVCLSFHETQHD